MTDSVGPRRLRTSFPAPPRRVDVAREKRSGWIDHGILVVSVDDDRLAWDERCLVSQLGRKLYGARSAKEPGTME